VYGALGTRHANKLYSSFYKIKGKQQQLIHTHTHTYIHSQQNGTFTLHSGCFCTILCFVKRFHLVTENIIKNNNLDIQSHTIAILAFIRQIAFLFISRRTIKLNKLSVASSELMAIFLILSDFFLSAQFSQCTNKNVDLDSDERGRMSLRSYDTFCSVYHIDKVR
jgi:hypothetical protein